jgi:hypothetical protein
MGFVRCSRHYLLSRVTLVTEPQSAYCRCYVLSDGDGIAHYRALVNPAQLHLIAESGGKILYSNLP